MTSPKVTELLRVNLGAIITSRAIALRHLEITDLYLESSGPLKWLQGSRIVICVGSALLGTFFCARSCKAKLRQRAVGPISNLCRPLRGSSSNLGAMSGHRHAAARQCQELSGIASQQILLTGHRGVLVVCQQRALQPQGWQPYLPLWPYKIIVGTYFIAVSLGRDGPRDRGASLAGG